MPISRFQEHIRSEAIQLLELQPMDIAELAKVTGINYHSMRNAIRALENEGTVKPVTGTSYRNVKFTMGSDHGPNNIIPMIRATNDSMFKLQTLLELRKTKKLASVNAVVNLPRHVARLLMASIRLNNSDVVPEMTLASLRVEMEKDMQALETSVSVYRQILDNSRIWNTETLRRFPDDVTFDADEVTKAYTEYFSNVTSD